MSDYIYVNQHEVMFVCTLLSILLLLIWDDINKTSTLDGLQWQRWLGNFGLTFISIGLSIWVLSEILDPWSEALSNVIPWSPPLASMDYHWAYYFIPGILLMELVDYLMHILAHKWKPLWRLHAVHHSDTRIDASTAHRHHPIESISISFIAAPLFVAAGVPLMASIWYPLLRLFLIAFNHSNTLLPEWLDKILRPVLATPNFHRVHHFDEVYYTDSNYGTALSIYDHIFGTARLLSPEQLKQHRIGLEYMREKKQSRLDQLLLAPFRRNFGQTDNKE
ncbi:MAG: sterol desaturase family protein [Cellvibrionaceae bacterium]|nr:sterol desaturase family protein [Cellvibrionaceae bacterium]MCV6627332.1 sterol desaturase family protein [Cellvibrionaceae bacterium]